MISLESLGIKTINSGSSLNEQVGTELKTSCFSSINPATEEKLGTVYFASGEDYEKIIQQAQIAFLTWRKVPAPKRAELIRLIADKLRSHKDMLGNLITLECGKSKSEADGEVQEMIDLADFAVGLSRMLYGRTMPSERPSHRIFEQWHPYGVVGIISAFNFPMAVWSWNAFLAAVCGNTVIWKPSRKVALCAIAVHHICEAAMKELNYPNIFSFFIGERDVVDVFVQDNRIPLLSFTGSTRTGKEVATKVAMRLGKSILELGGNNAVIVDECANLSMAVTSITFGAVGTAGQRCTTTRRVFVHKNIYEKFIVKLIAAYKQITIGNPLDTKNLMGPLIDKAAVRLYEETLDEIKMHHGKILFGGKVLNQKGFFVEPTIVAADADLPLLKHETFVPILYVMTFTELQKAIDAQNAVSQGLSSAIFTNNFQHAEQFISVSGSDCGLANINIGTSGAEIGAAFGGEKETGGGREAGSDAWKAYMHRLSITINWGDALPLAQGIDFKIKDN